MRGRKIWLSALVLGLLLLAGAQAAKAHVFVQCPPDTDGVDTDGDGIVNNDYVCYHLSGGDGYVRMADGLDMYAFGFSDLTGINDDSALIVGRLAAETPAPPLVFREGQKVFLTLTNTGMFMRPDLFDPHSVHFHGFPNAAVIFDGEPMASISINMSESLTYYYNLVEPGTFMYHCHVEATEHMQMGMLGILYVRPRQDMLPAGTTFSNGFVHQAGYKYAYNDEDGSTYYDVDFPIQVTSFDPRFHWSSENVQPLDFAYMHDTYPMINGRGYPDTVNTGNILNNAGRPSQKVNALVTATQGQKVLLRISSLATGEFYTVGIAGIPMTVVGQGARLLRGPDPDGPGPLLGKNLYYTTQSLTLGGGQSVDVILDTAGVPAGTYCLYGTNLNQLSNDNEDFGGMMTEIRITP
ncbi:MAG: multicopper oxidase domain-containing protein [Acidobacteriota bacterium]